MEKTLINQAVKNAVGQESCENTSVQEAEKTDPAALSAREFEDFLASIVTGVIQNVVDVRAGKLKPDEASSRDDATVRTLAQILMGEHERIRLMLAPGTPKPGPELVAAMKANLPALFRDLPQGVDAGNPRALMVHASRVFLREIYTMLKAAAAEGGELTPERLKVRIERTAFVWGERFLGDTLNETKPSLGAIDIVDGIFRQALRNMAKRLSMLRTGEMTPEELDAANEKLVFWLASTFSGENRHFETVDEWHPYGLSDELERIFGDHLSIEGGQGDDRTIARAARLFVREGEAMLTEALEAGLPASSAAETEPAVIFAARWANLFAGQLAEWPED